ncbi:hypothetical protein ACRWQN_15135 [Shewanella sp. HL-SH8]|uniref:hypothetical protein n=1 Tax=Shewanella sp. HL-SH8 TaxID=3436242 RepID=UPI003EB84838
MIEIFIVFLLFFISVIVSNHKLRFFSLNPTVLGSFLFLALFVQILPGTILVSFFDFPMVMNIEKAISSETLSLTFIYTFISVSTLFFLLGIISFVINLDINLQKVPVSSNTSLLLLLCSLFVVTLKIASIGNIPLFMAIGGDFIGAGLLKAKILKNEIGLGGLFLGYIFAYFPFVSLVYSYVCKNLIANSARIFNLNMCLIIFYSLYDMQKSKLIIVFFILFVLYLKSSKKINYTYFILIPLISMIVLISSFMLLHNSPLGEVFYSVVARIFIGQAEGGYMMYSVLTPSLDRVTYGMPLAGSFGFSGVDPAAEIISIFFPTAGDAWVNSNSYVQAHAWSIFGLSSLVIAPVVICINIIGLYFLRRIFTPLVHGYAHAVYIVSILMLPLNNDFSYFLFFKSWVCYLILMIFFIVIMVPIYFFKKGDSFTPRIIL